MTFGAFVPFVTRHTLSHSGGAILAYMLYSAFDSGPNACTEADWACNDVFLMNMMTFCLLSKASLLFIYRTVCELLRAYLYSTRVAEVLQA